MFISSGLNIRSDQSQRPSPPLLLSLPLLPAMSDEKGQLEIDKTNLVQEKVEEVVGAIDEKKLVRKLDLHLLPRVFLLFLLVNVAE